MHGGPAQIVKEVVAEVAHEVAEAVGRPLAAVGAKAQYVGVKAAEGLGDAAVFAADAVVGPTVEDADLYLHESPAVATAPGSSRSERAAEKARKKEERQEMQEDYKEAQRKLRQEHDIHKGEGIEGFCVCMDGGIKLSNPLALEPRPGQISTWVLFMLQHAYPK